MKLFLTLLVLVSCIAVMTYIGIQASSKKKEYTAGSIMPLQQDRWFAMISSHESALIASENVLDREYKASLYRKALKSYLSTDSNKVMKNWVGQLKYFYRLSDSLYEIKIQGSLDEQFATITTHRKEIEQLQLDSFVTVSGLLIDTLSVDEESITPHTQFFFILDSIKKAPVSQWYNSEIN